MTIVLFQVTLRSLCQSCLRNLTNQLEHYEGLGLEGIQVPLRFKERAEQLLQIFEQLSSRDEQRTNQIEQTVRSYQEFVAGIDELGRWVWSQGVELAELREMEKFAMEFSSHTTRLEVSNLLVIYQ